MTYEETIVLVDGVSGPAKAAADALASVGRGLTSVGKGLSKFADDASIAGMNRYAMALGSIADAMQRLSSMGGPKLPKLPSESASASGGGRSLASAAGVGKTSSPAPSAPSIQSAPMVGGKMVFDSSNLVAGQKAATGLSKSLDTAKVSLVKAQAMGDEGAISKSSSAIEKYEGALSKLPAPTKGSGSALKDLSKTLWDARNAMDVGRQSIGAAIGGIKTAFASLAQGDVKGAIAGVTDAIAGMAKMLDMVVPGLGELVSTVVSIVGGIAGAGAGMIVGGMKMAIGANEAKRAAVSMFDAMGEGAVTGEQVLGMLDGLSSELGIARSKLEPLTKEFLKMGVTSPDALKKLTTAAIAANAIVGEGGSDAFEKLQKKIMAAANTGSALKIPTKGLGSLGEMGLGTAADFESMAKRMGMSVSQLSGKLKTGLNPADAKKFGDALSSALLEKGKGPLETMAASMGNLTDKLHESFNELFRDVDVGPFMKEVKDLFSIFDSKGSGAGKTLKAGIGGFFKEVFATATKVVPMIKHFLLDMVIYGLKAYLAIKPIVAGIRDFAKSATGAMLINTVLDSLWTVLKVVGVALAVVIGFWASMVALAVVVGASIWTVVGALGTLAVTIYGAVEGAITGALTALVEWASAAVQMGTDFVSGLVSGITAGAGLVVDAVKGLAGGAVDGFKNALGIKSPSKVMMGLGGHTGAGFAEGLEASAPDVHGAASGVASMAVSGASKAASPGTAAAAMQASGVAGAAPAPAGATTSVTIENITINGADKSIDQISIEALSTVFEQAAMHAAVA